MNTTLRAVVRPLLPVFVVSLVAAALLGLWLDGPTGALAGIAAIAIGAILVSGSVFTVGKFTDVSEIAWRTVLIAAAVQFAVFVSIQYGTGQRLAEPTRLLLLVVGIVAVGLAVGFGGGRHQVSGLVDGALAGGIGGLLVILVAIERSFSMQPPLTAIVLISAVVAPILFGALSGLGGLVGGYARALAATEP